MIYYYFHGYGSSPKADKAEAMRKVLGAENVIAPDFNVDYNDLFSLFDKICDDINKAKDKVCIVGSSLGGLYAMYISARTNCNVILLNPCLFPMLVVPKVNNSISREILVKAQELSLYAFEKYNPENIQVWVTNDSLINHSELTKPYFYAGLKSYVEYGEDKAQGHEFIGFENIFKEYIEKNV